MVEQGKVAGKRALVTGADTGIGREIALQFARQGADVVLHFPYDDKGAESAVKEIQAMGRRSAAFRANFDHIQEVEGLARQAIGFLGRIDCLVNNAGITLNKPFLKTTCEQLDMLFHVNFRAQYILTQLVVKQMLAQGGGTICNLSSIHGLQGVPEHSAYAATKGAIISYTRALAVELAHQGIRVNAIAPGCIHVESHYKAVPGLTEDAAREAAHKAIPIARYGLPVDIAKLAVLLCSEETAFIVGQTIVADGGTTALMSLVSDFRSESIARFGIGYLPDV